MMPVLNKLNVECSFADHLYILSHLYRGKQLNKTQILLKIKMMEVNGNSI